MHFVVEVEKRHLLGGVRPDRVATGEDEQAVGANVEGGVEVAVDVLAADRVGQQWQDLLTGAHDAAAVRGRPWWENITKELGVDQPSAGGAEKEN